MVTSSFNVHYFSNQIIQLFPGRAWAVIKDLDKNYFFSRKGTDMKELTENTFTVDFSVLTLTQGTQGHMVCLYYVQQSNK